MSVYKIIYFRGKSYNIYNDKYKDINGNEWKFYSLKCNSGFMAINYKRLLYRQYNQELKTVYSKEIGLYEFCYSPQHLNSSFTIVNDEDIPSEILNNLIK